MAEPNENQNQEDVTLARVQEFIKEQVSQYAKDAFAEVTRQQNPQQPQLSQEEQYRQNVNNIISPVVDPKIHATQLEVADTRDMVNFYSNPDMVEYKEPVEKMFNELKAAGRAIPRQDIYFYLQGKMAQEKPEEFGKKLTERQQRQLDRANGSIDMGSSSLERARNDPVYSKDAFSKLSVEEMEKALDGITF